jgi:hypothetical protein
VEDHSSTAAYVASFFITYSVQATLFLSSALSSPSTSTAYIQFYLALHLYTYVMAKSSSP